MGDIISGLIGGVGSLIAGSKASKQAMTGYNYLTGKNGVGGYVSGGSSANTAEQQLLGLAPVTASTQNGFNNYLNSTGYNFQMKQGQDALTGSAAARGILNSGATAKALTAYGQNLGATTFNNYLGQVSNVANQGLTASGQIGQAGTQGGATAAQATYGGIAGATGAAQSMANPLANFFGGL